MHFTSLNTNILAQEGAALDPLLRALPLDPTRGTIIGGQGSHSWVLALHAQCFSLQAIPKSWQP